MTRGFVGSRLGVWAWLGSRQREHVAFVAELTYGRVAPDVKGALKSERR